MDLLEKYKFILEKVYKIDEVLSIIIFGSYSRDRVKPLSDLDICVIFKENTPESVIVDVLSYGNDKLDLVAFHKMPLSLQYEIITTGKIWKNKVSLVELKFRTINKWIDFKPLINRLYESRGLSKVI